MLSDEGVWSVMVKDPGSRSGQTTPSPAFTNILALCKLQSYLMFIYIMAIVTVPTS